MKENNICQEFGLKNIYETRNYLLQQIEQSELMNRKHQKICTNLNYIELFLPKFLQLLDVFQLLLLLLCFVFL